MASKKASWMWSFVGAAIIVLAIGGMMSFSKVEPGEVGVRLNRFTGNETIVDRPGMVLTLPLVHDLYIINASPQTLYLQGNRQSEDRSVLPLLTVRANDGSNFRFERMTIQYQVIAQQAVTVLHERGEGDHYREWMLPTVRAILRDEFGRQSTRDVSNPATYNAATAVAETGLNDALNPHGLRVINVDTPEPRFSAEYEETIEARNTANNALRVISEEQDRAATTRARSLATLDQRHNQEYQQLKAELEGELAQVQADRQRRLADAQANLTRTEGEALSQLDSAQARAGELRSQIEAEIAQVQAQIEALEANGVEAVMRQLARRLEGVRIDVQPYQDDPAPQSIRVDNVGR